MEKIEPLGRYFDGLHDIRVVLINEDEQKKVEIICNVIRGKQLVAKASHDNLSAALDEAATEGSLVAASTSRSTSVIASSRW